MIVNPNAIFATMFPISAGIPGPVATDHEADRFAAMPTPVLRITARDFAPDLQLTPTNPAWQQARIRFIQGQQAVQPRL